MKTMLGTMRFGGMFLLGICAGVMAAPPQVDDLLRPASAPGRGQFTALNSDDRASLQLLGPGTEDCGTIISAGLYSHNLLRHNRVTGRVFGTLIDSRLANLNGPAGIAFRNDGVFCVTSFNTDDVLCYHWSLGEVADAFVVPNTGALWGPTGILFTKDKTMLVASSHTDSILEFTADGELIDAFVLRAYGGLDDPRSMMWSNEGTLYVCSFGTDSIKEYEWPSGMYLGEVIRSKAGGLDGPTDVDYAPDGTLLVASFHTDSILRYQLPTGAPLGATIPRAMGGLDGPTSFVITKENLIYVASLNNNMIKRYLWRPFPGTAFLGNVLLPFNFFGPSDLAIVPDICEP